MLVPRETVTINAAFLQEIKEDNEHLHQLLAEVHEMCEACLPARIRPRRFAELLAELRDQLAMHFSLEEAFGYLDVPESVTSGLSERAKSLRNQHVELYEEISSVAETAADILFRNGHFRGVRQVVRRFRNFHSRLQDHETQENKLIAESYCVDIGMGD
jgi:iron-sulfur cluster repair protein YtfE (RIC family)